MNIYTCYYFYYIFSILNQGYDFTDVGGGGREGCRRLQMLSIKKKAKPRSTNKMPSLQPGIHETSWQRAAVSPQGSEAGPLPVRRQLQPLENLPRGHGRGKEYKGARVLSSSRSLCWEHPPSTCGLISGLVFKIHLPAKVVPAPTQGALFPGLSLRKDTT